MIRVRIQFVSSALDEETGDPFRWHTIAPIVEAIAIAKAANDGTQLDPWGKPWGLGTVTATLHPIRRRHR